MSPAGRREYGPRVNPVLRAAVLAPALAVALGPLTAWAQRSPAECRPNPHLPRAKDEYDRLQFGRAGRTLQRAIEHARNCRDDLAEIYRLQGFVDAVNAERERCQRAFEILLALEPDHVVSSDVPPKIRSCFENALQVAPARRELALDHRPPDPQTPDAPVSLPVRVVDPLRLVDRVQVWFRRRGIDVYTTVSVRADDRVAPVIPALAVPPAEEGYAMEYFVRAVDRWEGTLAELGSPRRPLVFRVEAARRARPIYTRWWFWTAIGVAAAGAGGAAWAVAESSDDDIVLDVDTVVGRGPRGR